MENTAEFLTKIMADYDSVRIDHREIARSGAMIYLAVAILDGKEDGAGSGDTVQDAVDRLATAIGLNS